MNTMLTSSVSVSDADNDPLIVSVDDDVSHGTLSMAPDGTFSYTPDTDYIGTDSFTFNANDGSSDSNSATFTIAVGDNAPIAAADGYTVSHDQCLSATSSVLDNDSDPDSDPMTALVDGGVSSGILTFNADGSFTYTPNPGFVGIDSFTYKASDGVLQSTPKTVAINVTNSAPMASDDAFGVTVDDPPLSQPLYVLSGDSDLEGDDLTITAVSASTQGASIAIDSSGKFLWYTPPPISGSSASIGGNISYDPDDAPAGTGVINTTDPWGFDPFTDRFTYTVRDVLGLTAVAQVTVQGGLPGSWRADLKEDYNTAAEFGIDGTPGYSGVILQVWGEDARGAIVRQGTQLWQDNRVTSRFAVFNASGVLKAEERNNVSLVDSSNIRDQQCPVAVDDTLELVIPAGVTPLFIWQVIDKTVGFNPPGKLLQVPATQPWVPTTDEAAVLAQMVGPTMLISQAYFFVDKTAIEAGVANGSISASGFQYIKNQLAAIGQPYEHLPSRIERFQLGDFALWEVSVP